jgi:hypothetical protein
MYTWSNNQENPTLEKLDRILVSKEWEDIFPNALVRNLPREVSDHNPLILSSGPCQNLKRLQFRFDLNWLTNLEFMPIFKKFGIDLVEKQLL